MSTSQEPAVEITSKPRKPRAPRAAKASPAQAPADSAVYNPLRMFRAPENWETHPELRRRSDIQGGYFTTRQEDVSNANGPHSSWHISPGDLSYLPDPTLELDFKLWEDNTGAPGQLGQQSFSTMISLQNKGYNIALAGEFAVNPRKSLVWKGDAGDGKGRITYGGMPTNTYVVMWCTGEQADANEKTSLRHSDSIQQAATDAQSALRSQLGRLGVSEEYVARASVINE